MANAAHELKTPVAVVKSTLQSVLQRPRTAEEYRAGLERSLEDLDRLEQLLQRMLRLARAELARRGLTALAHSVVPPNDGGLALGQVAVACGRASKLAGR